MLKYYFLFLLCFVCISCSSVGKRTSVVPEEQNIEVYNFPSNDKICIIDSVLDLQSKCFRLPANITLKFNKGKIKNGTLIGNKTKIIGTECIFDNVTINGTWEIEKISTSMFCNLNDTNSLKNVFALASPDVMNEIRILKGNYIVNAVTTDYMPLNIPSNTKLIIDGTISIVPNDLKKYSILNISKAVNVSVCGNGFLIGERDVHKGKEGEWGMCISLYDSDNISIRGLSLSKGWGDGIYVGRGCKKIIIEDCNIDKCRRQGISVIEGTDVQISNCYISNIHGTAPGYAIDVEPNARNSASNIVIKNVVAKDCRGGFSVYTGKSNGSRASNVRIEGCTVSCGEKAAFSIKGANNVSIKNNNIKSCKYNYAFDVERSNNITIVNNIVCTDKYVFKELKSAKIKGNRVKKGTICPFIEKK